MPSKRPGACSILVVDDEEASGELIAQLLRSQGYVVRLACDGTAALPLIAKGGIDLLLLDLMMSKMDGVEVCTHVRTELHDAFLPIVITTSLNDRESRIRAKEAGADDVLVKPVDGLELLVRIESLLRTRAQLSLVMRERDRAVLDLLYARTLLQTQQRSLRAIEATSEAMRALLDRQRRSLEGERKRSKPALGRASEDSSSNAEARDELQRLTQLTTELQRELEQLAGATTGTVARVAENADVASEAVGERPVVATAIK